jgi:hypothetical protein
MTKPRNHQADGPYDETVISPRFDRKAVSHARRVVPIAGAREVEMGGTAARSFQRRRTSSNVPFSRPSWPLALLITLALVAVAAGAVAIKRQSSTPSQYQEPASATAYAVIAGELDEDVRATRSAGSPRLKPRSRVRHDYGRDGYYNVLSPGKAELNEGRGEGRGKFEKGEGRGEEKRGGKEDKWRDKEKGRGKGHRGKGVD